MFQFHANKAELFTRKLQFAPKAARKHAGICVRCRTEREFVRPLW